MSDLQENAASPDKRRGSLLRTMRAVGWGFLGLRKGSEYQQDLQTISPLHLIAVAIIAVVVLVLALVGVVHWVV